MYFTHCAVQKYIIMFRRFLFSRIWSSAQDYAVLGLLLNPVVFWISTRQNLSVGNDLYWRCTSFEKAFRRGRPLKNFTWFRGVGGMSTFSFFFFRCMVALTTNFARKRVKTRYLSLFRATKNFVVICRASLLYEMGFRPVLTPLPFNHSRNRNLVLQKSSFWSPASI